MKAVLFQVRPDRNSHFVPTHAHNTLALLDEPK